MRENYLACGNPDHCIKKVILAIAIPKAFKSQTPLSYAIVLLYGWSLVTIIPLYMGYWWTKPQKTKKGLSQKSANSFFTFAFEKKSVSITELISLLCKTEEIYEAVKMVQLKRYDETFLQHFWTV